MLKNFPFLSNLCLQLQEKVKSLIAENEQVHAEKEVAVEHNRQVQTLNNAIALQSD